MITTIGQLLEAFIEKEAQSLAKEEVKHRPTLGGMYEDLTTDVLNLSVISRKPLQVVSGFIIKPDGTDSPEMDCMLVAGEPIPIRRTGKVRCIIDDVVAVVQSKKTLTQQMVLEGIDNLAAVRQIRPTAGGAWRECVRLNFQLIAQAPLPADVSTLPPHLEMLYHQLVVAAVLPTCIVLSYGGYRSHNGFRKGLIGSLGERVGARGYGPMGLPDLILNQRFAAVKLVGLPWAVSLQGVWWPLLATTESRPTAAFLLESIYTKLVLRELAHDTVFGEDLEEDPLTLLASYRFDSAKKGWELRTVEGKGVATGHDKPRLWKPVFLTDSQHTFVSRLCHEESIAMAEPKCQGLTDADMRYLMESGLVGRQVDEPNRYCLLTMQCECCILPDGRIVAGENNSGRLTRWVEKFMTEWGAQHGL